MIQDKIFFKKEGDNWFERNRELVRANNLLDPALWLIEQYRLKPKRVLEIGASNGWRLAIIADKYKSKCVGVEPSAKAVKDGTKNFPKITLRRGLASDIPVKEKFDVVIINYVMHWISREELLKSVAEIDRMVADGGYLIIGDFAPDHPTKTTYHHLPKENVSTFKLDYAGIFTSTALYSVVSQMTFNHADHDFIPHAKGEHRGVVTLLRKSLGDFYVQQ